MVRDYIATAEPVGSGQVAKRKGIHLSSATIRTVMSELEERGFLRRAHASSGRIPTPGGYRFYVDEMMRLRPLTPSEKAEIRRKVEAGSTDMKEVLREACHLVSLKAHQPGIAMEPRPGERSLRQIQFVRLRGKVVLAILISGAGIVENKILEIDRAMPQEELNRMHNYLNDRLGGLSISDVRREILLEMKRMQTQYDEILNQALMLGEKVFSDGPPDVHIEGQSLLVSEPEFSQTEQLQRILRTLEEKTMLVRLLDQSLANIGVRIFIGDDQAFPEINGLTVISSVYSDSEGNRGLLGVIGPTRIDYARIVPLVDFTATMITEVLQEKKE